MKTHSKGFTLIEVLIALVIIAISMLGIYELLSTSIDTAYYAKTKLQLFEDGFKTILLIENFKKPLNSSLSNEIVYSIKKQPTMIAQIIQVTLEFKKGHVKDHYIFYEKQ